MEDSHDIIKAINNKKPFLEKYCLDNVPVILDRLRKKLKDDTARSRVEELIKRFGTHNKRWLKEGLPDIKYHPATQTTPNQSNQPVQGVKPSAQEGRESGTVEPKTAGWELRIVSPRPKNQEPKKYQYLCKKGSRIPFTFVTDYPYKYYYYAVLDDDKYSSKDGFGSRSAISDELVLASDKDPKELHRLNVGINEWDEKEKKLGKLIKLVHVDFVLEDLDNTKFSIKPKP